MTPLLLKVASHTSSAETSQIITSPVRYMSPHVQHPPLSIRVTSDPIH